MSSAAIPNPTYPSPVNASDRISFTLFLAAAIHAIVIFGVGFGLLEKRPAPQSLEITLVRAKSATAPEDADFLAQANQEGSGSLKEKALLTTPEIANFSDNAIHQVQPQKQAAPETTKQGQKNLVSTVASSQYSSVQNTKENKLDIPDHPNRKPSISQRSLEIASLEAKLQSQKQIYAKRPRKRQLTAESAKESRDAAYIETFRRRIEQIGNLYYPEQARIGKIFGSIRLMVAINSNGSVHDIQVLKSSGHRVLDDAAIRSVQKAAPFDLFPPAIKKDTDILEIIRTWQFEKGSYFSKF